MALATLPLRDESPRRAVPWVVLTLIGLNVAVFLFLQPASLQQGKVDTDTLTATEDRALSEHTSAWGVVPCEVRVLESRSEGARCTSDADRPIVDGKPILATLLTALFLHGSLQHLGFNMLFLWVFGAAVEDRLGPGPFLGLYLVGGLLGNLAYVLANAGSAAPAIGASGAISAAMGAFLVRGPRRRILSFVQPLPLVVVALPAWAFLAPYLVSQFATPDDARVAWQAHVGGMVAGIVGGAVLGWLVPRAGHWRRRRRPPVEARPDPSSWTVPAAPPPA
ncbi:MAG TPA: rhomboid family intramembrane serine protease [Acidimicrobiales bacterium]|nr:rhomboid family intramembrane serine protease [Acidimicrobiales bacterium]